MSDPSTNDTKPSRRERRRAHARAEIVEAARALLEARGLAEFTVAEVAKEVGVTKPAVYYYFPTRENLIFELTVSYVAEESDVVCPAIEAAPAGPEVLGVAARGVVAHYRTRLPAFRLVYLHAQLATGDPGVTPEQLERVHEASGRLYSAIERKLAEGKEKGTIGAHVHPRRLAVVTHTSALGLLTLEALADKAGDPLAHPLDALVEQLVRVVTAGAR